jgi:hypothetical protein
VVAPADTEEVAATIRACAATGTPVIPLAAAPGSWAGNWPRGRAPGHPVAGADAGDPRARRRGGHHDGRGGRDPGRYPRRGGGGGSGSFPLTLASQGSARIGGLLATNAGGVNVLRYGNARDLCLGIEAVLADGTVMHTLSGLRKNNMGYDLRHLLIGRGHAGRDHGGHAAPVSPKPAQTGAALMVVPDPEAALGLLRWRRRGSARRSRPSRSCTAWASTSCARSGRRCATPFDDPPEWMCLIDLGMGAGQSPMDGARDALRRGVRGRASSPTASSPIRGAAGRISGPCARRSRSPTAGSGRSRRTTSRCPVAAIPAFIAEAPGRLAQVGRLPDQLLRPSGRRQPALQRLSRAGPEPRRSRARARRDQAVRARPRARDGRLGLGGARDRAAEGG